MTSRSEYGMSLPVGRGRIRHAQPGGDVAQTTPRNSAAQSSLMSLPPPLQQPPGQRDVVHVEGASTATGRSGPTRGRASLGEIPHWVKVVVTSRTAVSTVPGPKTRSASAPSRVRPTR
ncbi:hypothetical protein [Nonomuraea sp. CA-141351]|uniref:hypothetical protein n=1 Tax=Nonomuraea sp. CA-141351 TaxID=3239996 RepID=UPI003D8D27C0